MTDEDSARLGRLSQWLVANAGGYLRNTLWVPEVTCGTCASPVEGYRRCFSCTDAERSHPGRIADLVVPVFYGIQGWQSGYLMYNYKGLPPQQRLRQTLSIALHLSWNLHRDCVARAVRSLPSVLATVPSTKGRTGVHPLDPVVDEARLGMPRTGLSAVHDPDQDKRAVRPGRFIVARPDEVRGKHVLLVDDTWTTGGHAQSACLDLKDAGAAVVTVWTLARWLKPGYKDNKKFVDTRLGNDFDPMTCPVGSVRCDR